MTGLVKHRDKIRQKIESGHIPKIVSDYKQIRDTEDKRYGKTLEELLEYVLTWRDGYEL